MPTYITTMPVPHTPAERVIQKFGNARDVARALAIAADKGLIGRAQVRTPATIYKWTWPAARGGTDGQIPTSALAALKKAGRLVGVLITATDLYGDDTAPLASDKAMGMRDD